MYILKPYILIIYFFFYFYFDYNSTIKNVHNFVFTFNIKKKKKQISCRIFYADSYSYSYNSSNGYFHNVLKQVFHNCDLFQIRREYGCYDEVFFSNYSLNKRQCNWIRFLRIVQSYDEQVNLIGTKVKGKLIHVKKKWNKLWELKYCSKW